MNHPSAGQPEAIGNPSAKPPTVMGIRLKAGPVTKRVVHFVIVNDDASVFATFSTVCRKTFDSADVEIVGRTGMFCEDCLFGLDAAILEANKAYLEGRGPCESAG